MTAAQFEVRVEANRRLSGGYFLLELAAAEATPVAAAIPGQFVMLRGEWGRELLNPRAFSILDAPDDRRFSILAKAYGEGTRRLKLVEPGDRLVTTGPLGVAFPRPAPGVRDLLVAGGVGLPPLHFYARMAHRAGLSGHVEMHYGGRNRDDLVLLEDLEAWNVATHFATEDGSAGVRGYVTAALAPRLDVAAREGEAVRVLACGPTPMLAAVRRLVLERGVQAHLCLEENMACGFGVCLGCAVPVYGAKPYRYCCTDGPVFDAREVRWP
ncbi:dihydroorotate dehydrogenase electron transfer subunit [Nannocystis radixulma]|uniref:Dihydroorotate dehydrogenase electron transfer subunit n=1 Tax=Nannocystis radixulma TaxID=2995305 RepID=A0ABT5BC51_9BACT|nr:dihydroorotate dehydrogenase electron transfer subunit [Nannocystis radixulma]MDC0671715.1 dihydroorotate dehydrogenase electron transfer subunit [Nannocystis radixulma]